MFTVELTKEEIAVLVGSVLVAEPTMPDAVAEVAASAINKFADALETVGI